MIKKVVKKMIQRVVRTKEFVKQITCLDAQLKEISSRLSSLEQRSQNRRHGAIDELADYLVGAQVPGDYLEFGVYKGWTFSYACQVLSVPFPEMRFMAFDSFEGLPEPSGIDAINEYSSNFHKNEFACTEEEFIENLRKEGIPMERVMTVRGWFDRVLTHETASLQGIKKIAAAWIDCDLYESTVPVLKFITPYLSDGSVILFDDWRCFRNHPDFGEQKACREWLENNPDISLRKLFSFGWHGIAFTVNSVKNS